MRDTLALRSQIRQYIILSVEYIGLDSIVYRAEDMQLSREVWLRECFPQTMAERHFEDDGQSIVFTRPRQNEKFTAKKIEFQNIYKKLKTLNYPLIPTIYQLFESSGTIYAVIQYHHSAKTFHKLSKVEKVYSEQQIGEFALSLVRAFVLLEQRQLRMSSLNLDILLIDKTTREPVAAFIEFIPIDEQGIQEPIYELGRVLREIMDSENAQSNEPLYSSSIYSEKLCELVNRMVSKEPSKHFKTLQELQNLLQVYQPSTPSYEPIVHQKSSSIFSLFARLASLVFIVLFAYNIFTQQERIDNNELNWFDVSRLNLVAYFGDADAQVSLDNMYMIGQGTQKDYTQAINDAYSKKEFDALKRKNEKNSIKVSLENKTNEQYRLGYQYEKGIKVDKNHKKAIEYYLVAAKLGNAKAQFRLAQLYERSDEITRNYWNYKLAIKWYKKASEHGDALAYYRVSKLYRSGHGVSKNKSLALQWCKEAAELGLGVARGIMGSSYEFGWGTNIDYKQASYWYKQAIQSGYKNAEERLKSLNKKIRSENEHIKKELQNQKLINTNIKRKAQLKKLKKGQKVLKTNNFNTSPVNASKCLACHGKYFQRYALGKSAIVSNMTHYQIEIALKGYKHGTYGGAMKTLMKGQVARYSDAALEAFSKIIGR